MPYTSSLLTKWVQAMLVLMCMVCISHQGMAQATVKGQIVDKVTREPISFATVILKQQKKAFTADIDGNFSITTAMSNDTLVISFTGYENIMIPLRLAATTGVFELQSQDFMLDEVVLERENPAHPILREVIKKKHDNDPRSLSAYEYESYSKVEVDVDNISEKFKEKKIIGKIGSAVDELTLIKDESGREVLPIFISETVSEYYERKNPTARREVIKATRVTGVGVNDQSFFAQFMGSSFQQFNFYENALTIFEKEFVSPITAMWKLNYVYYLEDTITIDGYRCFRLDVEPKRKQDLAFKGSIWIVDSIWALKKVDLTIPKEANLNFIETINIKQEWQPTTEGPWIVSKVKFTIDAEELTDNWAGMVVRSNTTNSNIKIGQPKDVKFYEYPLEVEEDAGDHDDQYWKDSRVDSLSENEIRAFSLIDSLKHVPIVKSYIDVLSIVVNGYKKFGPIDFGPYLQSYAYNDIEGHRIRPGFKTNVSFSKKWELRGYGAYGTKDQRFKYMFQTRWIPTRKPWTEFGLKIREDIDQIGITKLLEDAGSPLFEAFSRWGTLRAPYMSTERTVYAFRQLNRHFSEKITFSRQTLDPQFPFAYYPSTADTSVTKSSITTSELVFQTRFSRNELFVQNDNERLSLGSKNWPTFNLKYSIGFKGVFKSDFEYHKVDLDISQRIGMGSLGYSRYLFRSGQVFSSLPYPLLNIMLGNETPFYTFFSYNLMDYFEFVADRYVAYTQVHHFDGLFFNRVPLLKKLKWREVANFSLVWGDVSKKNFELLTPESRTFTSFTNMPYMEVGYGIENIFKILRIQAFHRISYLDKPDVRRFGIKWTLQFIL